MDAYSGYLTIKAFGPLKNKTYSNCWCILYTGKNDFPPHLDVYQDQKSIEPGLCKKSLDIVNAKWGSVETPDPAFCIILKGKRYLFFTKSENDCNIWCQHLCCLSSDLLSSRQAKDGMTNEGDDMVMQDNVVYAKSHDVSLFDVTADQNQGDCAKFGITGVYKLSVDNKSIKIIGQNPACLVIEWEHLHVRSYGSSRYSINITVGKKSPTGEGCFKFMTTEGGKIVEKIGYYTIKLKDTNKEEQVTTALPRDEKKKLDSLSSNTSSSFGTKKKPAPGILMPKPTSPAISNSPGSASSNPFDSPFTNQLNRAIGPPLPLAEGGKKLLESKKSTSNKSSDESLSKKDMKKNKKEKDKKAKQEEKVKKKEAKEKEKEEKQKQKKLKKEKGKGKAPVPNDNGLDNLYSEANESQPIMEGDYAECGFHSRHIATPQRNAESKVYSEPWGSLPAPFLIKPEVDDDDDEPENMYASPIKTNSGKENKRNKNPPQIDEESYEDISPVSPPSIPPKLEELGEDDSNNNVYDHFPGVTPNSIETPENIYGLESAKSLASNYESNPSTDLYSDCTYETVG